MFKGRGSVCFLVMIFSLNALMNEGAWASLESGVADPALAPIEVTDAVVFDSKSGQPICQVAVSNRENLVPLSMARASQDSFDQPLVADLRNCEGQEMDFIKTVSAQAQPYVKEAALVPVAGVLALTCTIGIMAGIDSVMAFEGYFAGPRRLKKKVYKENAATGALGGAAVTGSVVGVYELGAGFETASMLSTLGSGGVGLGCGMLGGITAFFVEYYKRLRRAGSLKPIN